MVTLKRRAIIVFVMLLQISVSVSAAVSIEDGIDAVEKNNYEKAFQIFKTLAEKGSAEAQFNLAVMYRQGKGVQVNKDVALKWFEKSAEQGLASAEYYLGHLYDTGDSVERNVATAVNWYRKAAEKGNPLAQSNLGVAYANGEGVNQDIIKAYVWFSLAAAQGLTAALENRNLLKKEMSEELQANAQRLTNDYFSKYVAPFVAQHPSKIPPGGHPGAADAHNRMNRAMEEPLPADTDHSHQGSGKQNH